MEIFTGAGRRRSWSAEQKAQIVAESSSAGTSVSAVARRHGLTPQQLFGWRRQGGVERVGDKKRLSFASVVVTSMLIEIEFGGATIRVPSSSWDGNAAGDTVRPQGSGVIVALGDGVLW
ncbi:MAG: transposase [Rhodocyclaceae bacterium]